MNEYEIPQGIKRLIAGKILGRELPEEEKQLLEEWLAASEEHRALFRRVESLEEARAIVQLESEHYGEKMAQRFMQTQAQQVHRQLYRRLRRWSGGVAAAVVLTAGIWLAMIVDPQQRDEQLAETQNEIVPGETKAVLTLAGGQRVAVLRAEATHEGNVFVDVKGNRIVPAAPMTDTVWHTLTIPAGGEFRYTLADGTEVWLNSASELRFPAAFTGKERRVCLQGEAFFQVKKDTCRQFVVTLPEGNIRVYGTRFVVTSYQEAPLSAVLVQGSIGFTSAKGQSVRLKPEERLVYESSNGDIRVEKVDTTLYTAWMNKMFVFRGQPLGEIMTTLARWYDLDVTFTDPALRNIRLSGRLNRYQDVRILLHTYEETADIRFHVDGRNIVVSGK